MGFAHDLSSAKPFQLHMLSEQNECETNWQRRICFDNKQIEPNSVQRIYPQLMRSFHVASERIKCLLSEACPDLQPCRHKPDIGAERKKRCHSATGSESSYNAICLIIIDILKI